MRPVSTLAKSWVQGQVEQPALAAGHHPRHAGETRDGSLGVDQGQPPRALADQETTVGQEGQRPGTLEALGQALEAKCMGVAGQPLGDRLGRQGRGCQRQQESGQTDQVAHGQAFLSSMAGPFTLAGPPCLAGASAPHARLSAAGAGAGAGAG